MVVAMQLTVRAEAALRITTRLYRELAAGRSVKKVSPFVVALT